MNMFGVYALCTLVSIAVMISYADRSLISTAIIPIAEEFEYNEASQGTILSAFFFGYAITQVIGGYFADHFDAKLVISLGFTLWSLFTILTPTFTSQDFMIPIITVRVFVGLAEGVLFPAIHSMISAYVPTRYNSTVVSVMTSLSYLGVTLAFLVSPYIIHIYGWRTLFHSVGLIGFVWLPFWMFYDAKFGKFVKKPTIFDHKKRAQIPPPFSPTHISMTSSTAIHKDVSSVKERDVTEIYTESTGENGGYTARSMCVAEISDESRHSERDNDDLADHSTLNVEKKNLHLHYMKPTKKAIKESEMIITMSTKSPPNYVEEEEEYISPTHTHTHPHTPTTEELVQEQEPTHTNQYAYSSLNKINEQTHTHTHKPNPLKLLAKLFTKKPIWAIIIVQYCFSFGMYGLLSWLPTFIQQEFNVSHEQLALYTSIPYVGQTIVAFLAGFLADWMITKRYSVIFVRKLLQSISMFVPALFLFVMVLFQVSEIMAVALLFVGCSASALSCASMSVNQLDILPEYAGMIFGLGNTFGIIAGIIALPILGVILQYTQSWFIVFSFFSVHYIIGGIFWIMWASGSRIEF